MPEVHFFGCIDAASNFPTRGGAVQVRWRIELDSNCEVIAGATDGLTKLAELSGDEVSELGPSSSGRPFFSTCVSSAYAPRPCLVSVTSRVCAVTKHHHSDSLVVGLKAGLRD